MKPERLLGLPFLLPLVLPITLAIQPAGLARLGSQRSTASHAPIRGLSGDRWTDVVVGHHGFSETTPNEVTDFRMSNPGRALIDRSARPNRVHVYDGAISRILGLSHLGHC